MSEKKNLPFLLSPPGKDYLWGGRRLKDDFSKKIELTPLAETWECSAHPDGESLVAGGAFEGMPLPKVLLDHPEYLGTHPLSVYPGLDDPDNPAVKASGNLPILVKFIDAAKDLSVQVHPDDAYANIHENGSRGKSEMWYVVDAAKDAELVYGFSQDVTKETLRKALADGTVEKYLQKVKIHKNDVFFIEAGTVHAIGAGALIAEIQESSNITYRMFDYNRLDKNGKLRPLHIDKALDVANLKSMKAPRQPMRVLRYRPGFAAELLVNCKYFQVYRALINTERCKEMADFKTSGESFGVLLCVDGCGTLFGDGVMINFFKGDCIFVPASSIPLKLHGRAQLLVVRA